MLNSSQQFFETIKNCRNFLIVAPEEVTGDDIAAASALSLALEKLGKKTALACQKPIPEKYKFLAEANKFLSEIQSGRVYEITIAKSDKKITQARYESLDDKIVFRLTAHGEIKSEDVKIIPGKYLYDAIIVVGSPDLESLGDVFEKNSGLFFQTPIINIDHKSANDQYGQINLVNLTASSSAEIVAELVESLGQNIIDEAIATNLLAGIMAETKSFRRATSPKTFLTSSSLIAKGAQKDKIVASLHKTKTVPSLKLLGKILQDRLEFDEEKKFVIARVKKEDFTQAGAGVDELKIIIEDLNDYFFNTRVKALFWENASGGSVEGKIQSSLNNVADKIKEEFPGALTNGALSVKIDGRDIDLIAGDLRDLLFRVL